MKPAPSAEAFLNEKRENGEEICKRFSTPPERGREKNECAQERETVIMFSSSPLVRLLMDVVKKVI